VSVAVILGLFASIRPGAAENADRPAESFGINASTLSDPEAVHITVTAMVDGSGRFIFSPDTVKYEHKYWGEPANVHLADQPWKDISTPPPAWRDGKVELDLTKAWIVERKGRDVIALEPTLDGFFLYLCDTPAGSAEYSVTIAIPIRK
jgi:hypothetical protein